MEFDLDSIRANEEVLRAKYGKSARDLDRESDYADERLIETADVSAMMKELLEVKKAFNAKKQEVHRLVTCMAGDAFIYYPNCGADNWIEDVDILDYYERIAKFASYGFNKSYSWSRRRKCRIFRKQKSCKMDKKR